MADRYQNRAFPLDDGQGHPPAQQRPSGETDPLAELARLIGQSDPFNNFGRDARPATSRDTSFSHQADEHDDAAAMPPGPPSWMQRMRQNATSQQEHERVVDDGGYHQSPPFALAAETQADPSRYDDVLYGEQDQNYAQQPHSEQPQNQNYADDQYAYQDDPFAPQDEAEPEEKPRRGGFLTVAVVVALGIVGTAGAYAYRSFVSSSRSGEPPVIKADTGPTKIVPPTNQAADGSKLIYDRIGQGGSGSEKVVSREEQPLDVNKSSARVVFPPLNQGGAAAPAPAGGARVASAPAAAGQNEEPRRVRTVPIRPDQAEPSPAPAPAKQPQRAAAPSPPAAAPVNNANASANSPLSLSPQQAAPAPQRPVSTTPPGAAGTYVVQVSSQRSEADAQASYRALQGKYPSVLASRQASIRRADLGDKGVYYRAMVGPFGSSDDATRLCDSLKAAGGQCNIMRN